MPRVLLAWESGAGRGHAVTLAGVARALRAPEHIDAALYRMEPAGELEGLCGAVYRGAGLEYSLGERQARGGARTATWGEFLCDLGFRDAAFLTRQIGWWRETIRARRIGLVVGDYAPCALLAARSLGVKAVGVGTGYGLPPAGLDEFPILIADYSQRIYAESEIVAAVNAALAHFDAPPVARAAEIYAYDDQLVRSLPFLDPYADWRTRPRLPPVNDVPGRLYEGGDEIFAYFSTTELADPELAAALLLLNAPLRLFAPGGGPALEPLARAGHIRLETAPVGVDLIARRSRMLLHSAQHGIVSLGIGCGLPQVGAPQHLEHEFTARCAEGQGVLRRLRKGMDAKQIAAEILDVHESEGLRRAARQLAAAARPMMLVDAEAEIRSRLNAVMTGA